MRKFQAIWTIGLIVTAISCTAPPLRPTEQASMEVPTVYKRYLQFAEPASGIEASFNPPVLRWPRTQGTDVAYDVRLSQDSEFADGSEIGIGGTPWAMFNPHTRLNAGTWYWQYRVAGEQWSPVHDFVISQVADMIESPPPSALLEGIPAEHPRVLVEKQELFALRTRANTPDARAILREADVILTSEIPGEEDGIPSRTSEDSERYRKFQQEASKRLGDFAATSVMRLSEAYLLTGKDVYRSRAIEIARRVAEWDPQGVTSSKMSDFSDARCMLAMAIAYDTFHEFLSADDRARLLSSITYRADRFYQAWANNIEVRLLSGHVWQHILHYFFQTSLAVFGDVPQADRWLAYAYELFIARTPILGGKDGGWIEGASYLRMNMEVLLEIPIFIKRYTGFDFINTHPWYVNNIYWMIYHVPPGSSADGFGDNTEEVYSPGASYAGYARELAKLTQHPLAAWYATACEQYEKPVYETMRMFRWTRLTHTANLEMPSATLPEALPTGVVFREIGLAALHTNPERRDENLWVAMRSSPFGCYGHFLADQNSFNVVYEGKRTFFKTGYKIAMTDPHRTGWYQHTKSTNSILVDGEGQPYSTEAYGVIRNFISGTELAYAMGDASQAYASEETDEDYGVNKFYRHLLLLKPDVLVVYDELEASQPVAWSWLIHSMASIEVNDADNSFQSDFGFATGEGLLVSSAPVEWAVADTFEVPAVNWRGSRDADGELKRYDDGQWHLTATTKKKVAGNRFLAVLRVGETDYTPEVVRREGTVTVSAGEWEIVADVDPERSPLLRIRNAAGTEFSYDGQTSVIHELRNGEPRTLEGSEIVPYDLRQRALQLRSTEVPKLLSSP